MSEHRIDLAPRGLNRAQAADYVGVGTSLFDELVADGRMPKPFRINTRVLWDRQKLDAAIDALSDQNGREWTFAA
jgi:predicted DNA-binding transcriptional regulator AlpA